MAVTINTNIVALKNQTQINKTNGLLQRILERLSTGKRINRASDDAAGLAVTESLKTAESASTVAMRNISDGISKISIADSALESASSITIRMKELATQASNGTLSDEQRGQLNSEFQSLKAELDRINPEFNGPVLGSTTVIQSGVGSDTNSQTSVEIGSAKSAALGLASSDISSQAGAQAALDSTSTAISTVAESRGTLGAAEQGLGVQLNNLQTSRVSLAEARSAIEDADIAGEAANMVAARIRLQGSVAVAAQANSQPSLAMRLLT